MSTVGCKHITLAGYAAYRCVANPITDLSSVIRLNFDPEQEQFFTIYNLLSVQHML